MTVGSTWGISRHCTCKYQQDESPQNLAPSAIPDGSHRRLPLVVDPAPRRCARPCAAWGARHGHELDWHGLLDGGDDIVVPPSDVLVHGAAAAARATFQELRAPR